MSAEYKTFAESLCGSGCNHAVVKCPSQFIPHNIIMLLGLLLPLSWLLLHFVAALPRVHNSTLQEYPKPPFRQDFHTISWFTIYFTASGPVGSEYERALIRSFTFRKLHELQMQSAGSQGPLALHIGDLTTGAPELNCGGPIGDQPQAIQWSDIIAIDFLQTMLDIFETMGLQEAVFQIQIDKRKVVANCETKLPAPIFRDEFSPELTA